MWKSICRRREPLDLCSETVSYCVFFLRSERYVRTDQVWPSVWLSACFSSRTSGRILTKLGTGIGITPLESNPYSHLLISYSRWYQHGERKNLWGGSNTSTTHVAYNNRPLKNVKHMEIYFFKKVKQQNGGCMKSVCIEFQFDGSN
jgi:hypothetical protein